MLSYFIKLTVLVIAQRLIRILCPHCKQKADIKNLVGDYCDIAVLQHQALKQDIHPLRLSGVRKVANGVTTVEEVLSQDHRLMDEYIITGSLSVIALRSRQYDPV